MGNRREEHERAYARAQRRARLEHLLYEPRADAVTDEEQARICAVRKNNVVEDSDVCLDLGGKHDGGCRMAQRGTLRRRRRRR